MKMTSFIALSVAIACGTVLAISHAGLHQNDSTDVIALVRFVVAARSTDEPYANFLDRRIAFFRNVPGLKRKYYTEGGKPGLSIGVYHWDSRTQALDYYDETWHADMKERMVLYSLEIVDVEVIQDNEAGAVTKFQLP